MTSASELFFNRRSRFGRNVDVQLGFDPSPSRSSTHSNRRHRHSSSHRRLDACPPRHPPRPSENDTSWPDQSSHSLPSSTTTSGNSSTQDRLASLSNDSRLPGAVLLARERLYERLRGAGASLSGSSNRAPSILNHNDHVNEDDLRLAEARDWVIAFTRDYGAQTNPFPEQQRSKRTPGLSSGALSSLLVEEFNISDNYDEDTLKAFQECSICLESFKNRDKLVRLHCGHRFHYSCLVPWVRICGCCPYCRTDIVI